MSDDLTITVTGVEEVSAKMQQMVRDVKGGETLKAMKWAVLRLTRRAKKNLVDWRGPGVGGVDTGRLRASIAPEIRKMSKDVVGVVGSNIKYAPYQELGFRAHWVSVRHIGVWAKRHLGRARAVFVSGKALKYLQRAVDSERAAIFRRFEQAITKAVRK